MLNIEKIEQLVKWFENQKECDKIVFKGRMKLGWFYSIKRLTIIKLSQKIKPKLDHHEKVMGE